MKHFVKMKKRISFWSMLFLICLACQTQNIEMPSANQKYWEEFQNLPWVAENGLAMDSSQSFYETIADAEDIQTQCLGVRTFIAVDGAEAMSVFRKMVQDKRFPDEVRALEIYGSIGASFLAKELPCALEYEKFLKWALSHEKGVRSRSKLDSIFQRSDSSWHGSRERLRFLEKTLALADTEPKREFIRRKIKANNKPLPVPVPPSRSQPKIIITP